MHTLREEALEGDVPRDPNDLNLVGHLGAAERRYTEIDARKQREEDRSARVAAPARRLRHWCHGCFVDSW